jgi:outer membrane receptor for ferrienterochelin and colicins
VTRAALGLLRNAATVVAVFAAAIVLGGISGTSACAQGVTHGTVVSKLDGSPVVAAEILTPDGRVKARTDNKGRFQIPAAQGDSVAVRALGYRATLVAVMADTIVVRLEAYATVLAAVTTTAGQRTIRVNESTASVSVVDRREIAAAAAVGASQILREMPGLQELPSPPSKSTISIRGLDAARVLVLVDGEPVGGALIDTRDIGRLSTVATERIEVTKGPSSVEFGSDALGGVINLVTAAPSKKFAADAIARVGGLGRRESSFNVSNTVGALGYRLSGGWRQVDRLMAVDAEGSSLDRVYDLRSDVRYRASDALMLRGDVQLSQERQRYPVGGGYNGFIDNHGAQVLTEAKLLKLGGVLRARLFGQYSDYQFRQSALSVPIAGSADSLVQEERLGRAMLAYTRAAGSHMLDAGAQLSARSIVAPHKIEGNRASDQVVEFFARDAWTRGPVLVTAGARSTSSSLWGSALTPSLGAAWQVAREWRGRASISRGFRAPSFKEMRYTFSNPIASYTIVGNSNLKPESSWNTDLGLTFAPRTNVAFELDGYRTRVSNLIDTRFTGLNAAGFQIYQNLNVARASIAGVELTARIAMRDGEASLGYNYLRARDADSNRQLDRRATHTARAQISHRWRGLSGLLTDLSAHYTGKAPIGQQTQGAMFSIDGQLRYDLSGQFELSAGVNNLFDQRPALWTPASQRQLFVGLRSSKGLRSSQGQVARWR